MLIYSGNTPIILPSCPTPNNDNKDNKDIIISLIIIAVVSFIIIKLIG
jgi:hypothetical protein